MSRFPQVHFQLKIARSPNLNITSKQKADLSVVSCHKYSWVCQNRVFVGFLSLIILELKRLEKGAKQTISRLDIKLIKSFFKSLKICFHSSNRWEPRHVWSSSICNRIFFCSVLLVHRRRRMRTFSRNKITFNWTKRFFCILKDVKRLFCDCSCLLALRKRRRKAKSD